MPDEEVKPDPAKEGEAEPNTQPPEEADKKAPKEEVPPEVWQKHTERFKKEAKQEMAEEIAKSLGMKVPEDNEKDPVETLTNRIKELEKTVGLKEWEARNPFVLEKENEEKWKEALKNSRYEGLEYDEIAKLAGVTSVKQEAPSGSVPSFNKVIQTDTSEAIENYKKGNKNVWKFD